MIVRSSIQLHPNLYQYQPVSNLKRSLKSRDCFVYTKPKDVFKITRFCFYVRMKEYQVSFCAPVYFSIMYLPWRFAFSYIPWRFAAEVSWLLVWPSFSSATDGAGWRIHSSWRPSCTEKSPVLRWFRKDLTRTLDRNSEVTVYYRIVYVHETQPGIKYWDIFGVVSYVPLFRSWLFLSSTGKVHVPKARICFQHVFTFPPVTGVR